MSRQRDRLAAAFHEAGHCVVALELGIPPKRVRIGRDGSGTYWPNLPPWPEVEDQSDELILRVATWGLAGEIAQREAVPRSGARDGAADDRKRVRELLATMTHRPPDAYKLTQSQARLLLAMKRVRHNVETLAAELLVHRDMDGRAVMNVLRKPWR